MKNSIVCDLCCGCNREIDFENEEYFEISDGEYICEECIVYPYYEEESL